MKSGYSRVLCTSYWYIEEKILYSGKRAASGIRYKLILRGAFLSRSITFLERGKMITIGGIESEKVYMRRMWLYL